MNEANAVIPAKTGIQENGLPEGWEWSTLGDVCEKPQYGWTTKATQAGDLHLLRTTDITSGHINWETVPYCVEEPEDKEKYLIKDGDIVVSRAGSVGVSYLISNPEPSVFASYLIRFNPLIDRKYVYYFLKSPAYWNAISEKSAGIALQNVNASKLKEINIPVAPPEQQKRIVAKIEELFSHIDAGIEALKKAKQLLKQYRQSVLKAAVTGELTKEWREANKAKLEPASNLLERILKERHEKWEEQQLENFKAIGKMPKDDKWKERYKAPLNPDPSRIHELPKLWTWATFDQVSDRVTVGHVGSMKNEYIEKGVPFLRSQNVRENRYDPKGLKFVSKKFHEQLKKSSLQPDDLVTVRSGSVGVTCVIPESLKEANCSDLVIVKQPNAVIPKLAAYYMNTITQTKVAAEKVGVALTHFNTKSMAEMPLPVPPFKEQEIIVELVDQKLSDVEKLDNIIDEQLFKSERNKQAVLASAFSGNIN